MLSLVVSDPRWLSFPLFADVLPIRTDVHLVIRYRAFVPECATS